MFERVFRKLNELKCRITMMRDSKEKALLVRDYYNILYFLVKLHLIDDISEYDLSSEEYDLYDKRYRKEALKTINDIITNSDILKDTCQSLIDIYHANNFYVYPNVKETRIDKRKMHGVMASFFWNLNDNILSVYQKMSEEKRIIKYVNLEGSSVAVNTMASDFGYAIIPHEESELDCYVAIAHEMGHIYEMYLQRNNPSFFNVHLTSEVMSLTFKSYFIFFLTRIIFLQKKFINPKKKDLIFI